MKGSFIIIGLLLIIAGTGVLTHQGITFYLTTHHQKVLDVGPFEASTKQATRIVYLTPLLGGAGLAVGVLLVFIGAYKKQKVADKVGNQKSRGLSTEHPQRVGGSQGSQ